MVSNSENAISFDPSVGRPLNSAPNMVNPCVTARVGFADEVEPPEFYKESPEVARAHN